MFIIATLHVISAGISTGKDIIIRVTDFKKNRPKSQSIFVL